jgi:hypothetical protein
LGGSQIAWDAMAENQPPVPRDDRIWVGLLLEQLCPWSAQTLLMDWGPVLSWSEPSRCSRLVLHDFNLSPVSPFWEKVCLRPIRVPAGARRCHPSGHASLDRSLQLPHLPHSTYCNHVAVRLPPQLQHLSCCFEVAHVSDGCASLPATHPGT